MTKISQKKILDINKSVISYIFPTSFKKKIESFKKQELNTMQIKQITKILFICQAR